MACVSPPWRKAATKPAAREISWILGKATPVTSTSGELGTAHLGISESMCIISSWGIATWMKLLRVQSLEKNSFSLCCFSNVKWHISSDSPNAPRISTNLHKVFLVSLSQFHETTSYDIVTSAECIIAYIAVIYQKKVGMKYALTDQTRDPLQVRIQMQHIIDSNKKLTDRPWENPNPKCDTCAVHIVIITSAYCRWWTVQTWRPINFSSRILEVQVLQGWSANSKLQPSTSSQPLCCQLLRCSQTNLEGEAVLHSSQPPHTHTHNLCYARATYWHPSAQPLSKVSYKCPAPGNPMKSLPFCFMRLSPFDNTTTWCSHSNGRCHLSRSLIGFSAIRVDK